MVTLHTKSTRVLATLHAIVISSKTDLFLFASLGVFVGRAILLLFLLLAANKTYHIASFVCPVGMYLLRSCLSNDHLLQNTYHGYDLPFICDIHNVNLRRR